MNKEIQTVFLDVGGVLLLPDTMAIRAILQGYGIERDELAIDRASYSGGKLDFGLHPDDSLSVINRVIRRYAESLGVPTESIDNIIPALRKAILEYPWIVRVPTATLVGLRALAETGVQICFVSNGQGKTEETLREHGIVGTDILDTERPLVIDSWSVGYAKPDPRIFKIALRRAGARPETSVHVGDSLKNDVECAQLAGIRPLHFNPYKLCKIQNHDHVASLADVVNLVSAPSQSATTRTT